MDSAYKHLLTLLQQRYTLGEARAIALLSAEEVLGLSLTDIYLGKDKHLSAAQRVRWENLSQRLAAGEPIQYVLGKASFHDLSFCVTPATLIPRPETELLVDTVLQYRRGLPPRILDIGTGSGCIALTLKHEWNECEVQAWDISEDALSIARKNAEALQLSAMFKKVDALGEDASKALPSAWRDHYVIVTNPPYVCESERKDMEQHVTDFEPSLALFVPNEDPLRYYKAVARLAQDTGATAVFAEINQALGAETAQLFRNVGFSYVEILPDQFGRQRIVVAMRTPIVDKR